MYFENEAVELDELVVDVWALGDFTRTNNSEDVGQLDTRSGLDSRWEMVVERRVQYYCCQRCPAPRQNSSTMGGCWSRAALCCLRAALNAHLNHLKAPLTLTWTRYERVVVSRWTCRLLSPQHHHAGRDESPLKGQTRRTDSRLGYPTMACLLSTHPTTTTTLHPRMRCTGALGNPSLAQ